MVAGTASARPLFSAPYDCVPVGGGAGPIALGDLDSDGVPDMIVGHTGGWPDFDNVSAVSVMLGHRDGTFGAKRDFATGLTPSAVAIADLDLDGHPDVIVANFGPWEGTGAITVFLGHGDGTYEAPLVTTPVPHPRALAVGDLDGDGRPDLAVANGWPTSTLSVLLGKGDGTFVEAMETDRVADLSSVAMGDWNQDGKLDLAVTDGEAELSCDECHAVYVLLGNGDGTVDAPQGFGKGFGPGSLVVSDFDENGRLDLAYTNAGERSEWVTLLSGNGDGSFTPTGQLGTGANPGSMASGDFNRDGHVDLATVDAGWDPDYDANTLSVFLGNGDGTFQTLPRTLIGGDPVAITAADLDRDGADDLVFTYANLAASLMGNGDGTFGKVNSTEVDYDPHDVAIADFDSNALPDLVIADNRGVGVLLGAGRGGFISRRDVSTVYSRRVAAGDWNGDRNSDLAVLDYYGGVVSIYPGHGDGSFGPKLDYSLAGTPFCSAVADFNVDGKLDLAVMTNSASIEILLGRGDGTFQAGPDVPWGSGPLAAGDLNADGWPDLIVATSAVNYAQTGKISVFLGQGDGSFAPRMDYPAGHFAYSLGIADFNGDGRLDVVGGFEANDAPASLWVFLGDGKGALGAPSEFDGGPEPESMVTADFDLDGNADIAVGNRSFTSSVSVLLGQRDGGFSERTIFGNPGWPQCVTAADVDHDGWPDLVVGNRMPYDIRGRPFSNNVVVLLNNGGPRVSCGFRPGTLNLASKGPWITAILQPETGYGASEIDVGSLRLNDAARAEGAGSVGDQNHDGIADLTVRFDRSALERTLSAGADVLVHATGKIHGETFLTTGSLRVLRGGRPAEAIAEQPGTNPQTYVLALRGLSANPAMDGRPRVRFELRDGSPARLELMDLAGRRVSSRDVGAFGPGLHELELSPSGRLRPGVYFVRLTQGAACDRSRIVVLP